MVKHGFLRTVTGIYLLIPFAKDAGLQESHTCLSPALFSRPLCPCTTTATKSTPGIAAGMDLTYCL